MDRSTEKAIHDYVDSVLSAEVRRLINAATFDLYYGPSEETEPDGDGNQR